MGPAQTGGAPPLRWGKEKRVVTVAGKRKGLWGKKPQSAQLMASLPSNIYVMYFKQMT